MNEKPPQRPSKRTAAAIVIFVLCCLLSSAKLVLNATTPATDDVAQRSDQRFAALKAALPARGIVGYIGESGNTGTADYYLAQYALAPLIVEHSPNHALVVGNFPTARPASFPSNLQLASDFGNGLLLLRNSSADKGAN
jgi:hypothetical protein